MPTYTGDFSLNTFHGTEEYDRSLEKTIRKIIKRELMNVPRLKIATVTAVSGTTATIRYFTAESTDTISGVAIQQGLINDDNTLRIAVNDTVRVLIEAPGKRIILYKF